MSNLMSREQVERFLDKTESISKDYGTRYKFHREPMTITVSFRGELKCGDLHHRAEFTVIDYKSKTVLFSVFDESAEELNELSALTYNRLSERDVEYKLKELKHSIDLATR